MSELRQILRRGRTDQLLAEALGLAALCALIVAALCLAPGA